MPFKMRNVKEIQKIKERKKEMEAQKKALFQFFKNVWISIVSFVFRHTKGVLIALSCFICFIAFSSYISSYSGEVARTALSITSSLIGSDLVQDQDGLTHILLIGSGGEGHEGGYLTDSIIVMTLNHSTKMISMLSIPRDLFLTYPSGDGTRKGKINEVFRAGMSNNKDASNIGQQFTLASEPLKQVIAQITGVSVHYTVYIDFAGFVKVVDALGGVDIVVEKAIDDPMYPGKNYSYAPFHLKAGSQKLSGSTSLKFVRSRHGNSGGDFGRSARQKQMIVALKEKAFSSGILTSPSQIQKMLEIIKENFWTDFSWKELLSFVQVMGSVQKDNISSYNITNTDNAGMGWFLYTPPRDSYGGMSVLVPYLAGESNQWAQIQMYFSILSHFPELSQVDGKMHVLNTTKKEGAATELSRHLLRYGMKVLETANNPIEYPTTTVEYVSTSESEKIIEMLQKKFGFIFVPVAPSFERQEGHFYFLIGKDYTSKMLLWNPDKKEQEEIRPTSAIESSESKIENVPEDSLEEKESPKTSSFPDFTTKETVVPTMIPRVRQMEEVSVPNISSKGL